MFEGLVSSVLSSYLDQYVKNFDASTLKLSIFSGKVHLKNLKLQATALNEFDLPVVITEGHLGGLDVDIPWTSLQSSPVVAKVTDLFVVCKPKRCCEYSKEMEEKVKEQIKKKALKNYETIREAKITEQLEKQGKEEEEEEEDENGQKVSYTKKLTETIIANVQITVSNVHVRFEDNSDSENPVVLGAMMEKLHILSTNKHWEQKFIKTAAKDKKVYKIANLENLSAYMDIEKDPEKLLSSKKYEDQSEYVVERMKKMLETRDTDKTYVLHPINGTAKVKLQKDKFLNINKPRLQINIGFDDVSAALNTMQYQKALNLVDYLSGYKKYERFRHFKPKCRPMDSETRLKWWKYAYDATKENIDNSYFSMVDVLFRQKNKEKYMGLYKRSKKLPWLKRLNDQEKLEFKQIEKLTDTEDLLYFRELANKELEVEKEQHKHYVVEKKEKSSWFSSLLGGNKNSKKYSKASEDAVKLSDEQKEWLEEQFAQTVEEAEKAYKLPDDFTEIRIKLHVKKGMVSLVDYENKTSLVEACYSGIKGVIDKQRKPIKVSMELGDFKVIDKLNKETNFPYIAKRKTFVENIKPLVNFDLVLNPLDENTDIYMRADVDRLDVVLNVPLYQRILGFFSKPKNLSIKYIQKMATTTLSSATNTASAKLLLAFQNRKMLDVEINFNAPNFIVPTVVKDETCVILLNLGKFKISSDTKARDDYYEKFFLKMFDFNISTLTLENFLEQDRNSKVFHFKGNQFLENVNMDLQMHAGIGPLTRDQPKMKVQGNIEEIKFNFNPRILEQLLNVVNNVLALVDDPTGRTSFNCYHHGPLHVLGPASKNIWRLFEGELRKTGYLHLFKMDKTAKPSATINIDSMDIDLIQDVTKEMIEEAKKKVLLANPTSLKPDDFELDLDCCFGIELSQGEDVEPVRMYFQAAGVAEKENWVKGLRIQIVQCKALIADVVDSMNEEEIDSEAVHENIDEAYEKTLIEATRIALDFKLKNLAFIIGHTRDDPIANINFGDMEFSLNARKYDQQINMKLGNFQVEDVKSKTNILSYQKGDHAMNYVAELGFNNLKRGSPLLNESKANMNVSIKLFDHFCCVFDQYILAEYITYANDMKELASILDSKKKVFKINKFDSQAEQLRALKKPVTTQAVNVSLEHMNITLNEDGRHFATALVKDAEIFVKLTPSKLTLKGGITNVQLLRKVKKIQKLQEIVGMRTDKKTKNKDGKLINFKVILHKNSDAIYDKEITGELSNIEFFFIRRFITQMQFYFLEGPLMDVLKAGSKKAAKAAMDTIKDSNKNLKLIRLNVMLNHPRIILPRAATSGERIIGDLGKITIFNDPEVKTVEDSISESFHIELKQMDIKTIRYGLPKQSILSDANIKLELTRAVANPRKLLPAFDVNVFINKTKLALTHNQYEMIFEILKLNMNDTVLQDLRKKQKEDESTTEDTQQEESTEEKNEKKILAKVDFVGLDMALHRDCGQEGNDLAEMNFSNLKVDFSQHWNGDMYATVSLSKIDAIDQRKETAACERFKHFIDCSGFNEEGKKQFVEVEFSMVKGNKFVDIELGSTQFTVIPGVIFEIKDFFINQYSESLQKELQNAKKRNTLATKKQVIVPGNICFKTNHVFTPENPLILSDPKNQNAVVIDGNYCQIWIHGNKPAVLFDKSIQVKFINCVIYADSPAVFSHPENIETHIVNFSRLLYEEEEVVEQEGEVDEDEEEQEEQEDPIVYEEETTNKSLLIVRGVLHNPTFILPEDTSDEQSRALCVKTKVKLYYENDPNKKFAEEGNFSISSITAYLKRHHKTEYTNIIDPVSLNVTLRKEVEKPRQVNVTLSRDIQARISYQDVLLIKKIFTDFQSEQEKKKKLFEEGVIDNAVPSDDEYNSDHSFGEVDSVHSLDEQDQLFVDPESLEDESSILTPAAVDDNVVDTAETKAVPNVLSIIFSSKNNISVLIVDDVRGYDIPLVNFLLISPDVKANIISSKFQSISASAALSLQANYFNLSVGKWEPIVESWGGELTFYQEPTFDKDVPYTRKIQLQNNEESNMLNINVSQNMLHTLMTTAKLWKASFQAGKVISAARDPYLFRNHTGHRMTLKIKDENLQDIKEYTLKGYAEHSMELSEYALVSASIGDIVTNHEVTVHMDNHEVIETESKQSIVLHTHLVGSRRLIDIRSSFVVLNTTNIPWNIAVCDKNDRQVLTTVKPSESIGLPLHAIETKALCIQPAHTGNFEFSKYKTAMTLLNMRKEYDRARQFICPSIQPDQMDTYGAIVYINNNMKKDCELCIKTPMVLSNHMAVPLEVELYDTELVTDKQSHKRFISKNTINVGDSLHVYKTSLKKNILAKFSIQGFKSQTLALVHSTNQPRERKTVRMYTLLDVYDRPMNLKIDYPSVNLIGHKDVTIFTPYWIVNHTKYDLQLHHVNSDGSKSKSGGSFVPFTIDDKNVPVLPYTPFSHTRPQRIAVSIGDGEVSAPVILNTGIESEIQVRNDSKMCKLGINVAAGPGVFKKTKIVTIEDRYVVRNNTDIVVTLTHENLVHTLQPKEEAAIHFSPSSRKLELDMSIDNDTSYSKKLILTRLGEYYHAFPHNDSPVLIQCNLQLHRSSVFIDIAVPEKPPFTIKNELIDTSISISQHASNKWYDIDPTSTMNYCFDNHDIEGRLSIKVKHKTIFAKPLNINVVTDKPYETQFFDKKIYVSVYPTGPTRNVVVSYQEPKTIESESEEEYRLYALESSLVFSGIGLSFINSNSVEIAYMSLVDIALQFNRTLNYEYFNFEIGSLQIDNQSEEYANIPIIFSHQPVKEGESFLFVGYTRSLSESSISMWKYANLTMKEADVAVDLKLINLFIEYGREMANLGGDDDEMKNLEPYLVEASNETVSSSQMPFYFDQFQINPLTFNLTFKLDGSVESIQNEYLSNMLESIGVSLISVSNANIELKPLILNHHFSQSRDELQNLIISHYKRVSLKPLLKTFFALDVVGNPIGLYNDVSTGVHDFFVEPMKTISTNPKDVGKSIKKGTESLFTHSMHGGFSANSKFLDSVSRGISAFTFDRDYRQRRQNRTGARPSNLAEGFNEGRTALGKSLVGAFTGIVTKPVEGFKNDSFSGLFRGAAIGAVGVPAKPIIGVLDFISATSGGVANQLQDKVNIRRRRFIRTFHPDDNRVVPYNEEQAYAMFLLHRIRASFNRILYYLLDADNHIVILSDQGVYCINRVPLLNPTVVWNVDIKDIHTMHHEGEKGTLEIAKETVAPSGLFASLKKATTDRYFVKSVPEPSFKPEENAVMPPLATLKFMIQKQREELMKSSTDDFKVGKSRHSILQ